jgi:hypothetical protein
MNDGNHRATAKQLTISINPARCSDALACSSCRKVNFMRCKECNETGVAHCANPEECGSGLVDSLGHIDVLSTLAKVVATMHPEQRSLGGIPAADIGNALNWLIVLARRSCPKCNGYKVFSAWHLSVACPCCGAKHGERAS